MATKKKPKQVRRKAGEIIYRGWTSWSAGREEKELAARKKKRSKK